MTLEEAALQNRWARRSTNGGLVWIENELDVREIWETATATERERIALLAENRDDGWHSLTASEIRASVEIGKSMSGQSNHPAKVA